MSVTRATTTKELLERVADKVAAEANMPATCLVTGDSITIHINTIVATVTVTTEVAYRRPRLAGPRWARWLATRLGVTAAAEPLA